MERHSILDQTDHLVGIIKKFIDKATLLHTNHYFCDAISHILC